MAARLLGYPQGNAGSGQNLSGFSQTVFNATSCRDNGVEAEWPVLGPVVPKVGISFLLPYQNC